MTQGTMTSASQIEFLTLARIVFNILNTWGKFVKKKFLTVWPDASFGARIWSRFSNKDFGHRKSDYFHQFLSRTFPLFIDISFQRPKLSIFSNHPPTEKISKRTLSYLVGPLKMFNYKTVPADLFYLLLSSINAFLKWYFIYLYFQFITFLILFYYSFDPSQADCSILAVARKLNFKISKNFEWQDLKHHNVPQCCIEDQLSHRYVTVSLDSIKTHLNSK